MQSQNRLTQLNDIFQLLKNISDKSMREQKGIFIDKTGMSLRSFFRYRNEIGLKLVKRDELSEDTKKKMSKTAIKNWQKPEYIKSHSGHFKERNANWRGGKTIDGEGYVLIHQPHHPLARPPYILEHRLVMEQWLRENNPEHPALIEINGKKYLSSDWIPHHKNGDKQNNRIENLELMTLFEHLSFHNTGEKNVNYGKTGDKNPFYGKKHTQETKDKIGISSQKRWRNKKWKKYWLERRFGNEK